MRFRLSQPKALSLVLEPQEKGGKKRWLEYRTRRTAGWAGWADSAKRVLMWLLWTYPVFLGFPTVFKPDPSAPIYLVNSWIFFQ